MVHIPGDHGNSLRYCPAVWHVHGLPDQEEPRANAAQVHRDSVDQYLSRDGPHFLVYFPNTTLGAGYRICRHSVLPAFTCCLEGWILDVPYAPYTVHSNGE